MHAKNKSHRWRTLRNFLLLACILASAFLKPPKVQGVAHSSRQSAHDGAQLFQQHCLACHTIGQGDLVGPDLKGVIQRRDLTWVKDFIAQPDKVLASNDPLAQELLKKYKLPMPNLNLSAAQVQALVDYLENPDASGSAAIIVLSGGQAQTGQDLFTGQRSFTNAGNPCIACHSTAGLNAIGGGILGPDLTHVYGRLGDAGLSSALQGLPFPTMQGVFANHPLTPQEQADLFAYFQQTDQQPAQTSALDNNTFLGIGGLGALLLFGMLLVFWPRQRESISTRLRKNAGTLQHPK